MRRTVPFKRKPLLWFVSTFMLFLFLVNACRAPYQNLFERNLSGIYNPQDQDIHPEYTVYIANPSDTRLYFRIIPGEFNYKFFPEDSSYQANIRLHVRVSSTTSITEITDSITKEFTLKGKPRRLFTGFIPLSISGNGSYFVETFLTDLNTNKTIASVCDLNPSPNSRQNFLLLEQYGTVKFSSYVNVSDTFRIRTSQLGLGKLHARFYSYYNHAALPADVLYRDIKIPEKPDTSWSFARLDTQIFSLPHEGLLCISDTNGNSPFWTGVFPRTYPATMTPTSLFLPLKYLLSDKEFKYYSSMRPKTAIDSFWIETAGTADKARELIKEYYWRVNIANLYFYDVRQGWQTDRGMIYILFGAPTKITKNSNGELWIYGSGEEPATQFNFTRTEHSQFGFVYQLEPSEMYGLIFLNAVNSWRDGRVFAIR